MMIPVSPKILIVAARFYDDIADELIAGARDHLESERVRNDLVEVPGAFEIPAAIAIADNGSDAYGGYVALGCVIRGETSHYDYVCGESARGLQDLAIRRKLAIGYGILTTENRDQAWKRALRDQGNKGRHAAAACLAIMSLKRCFAHQP